MFEIKGSTVNQIYYIEVLKRLRDAVRRKRPEPTSCCSMKIGKI